MDKKRNSKKENTSPEKNKKFEKTDDSTNNPLLNVKTAEPLTRYVIASDEVKKQKRGQENG